MSPAEPGFQRAQRAFAAHLRDPETQPPPAAIEDRRMGIYRDLIYNNIEGFIRGAFPVLHRIIPAERWHALVREFVSGYRCQTPYFLEISEEFLQFLQSREPRAEDPPFMLELAHYEWVELALDVAPTDLPPEVTPQSSLLETHWQVSPLVWPLSYVFPVHRLGPDYQPAEPPADPTFLLVYRNRADEVRFMASNAVTVHLLQGLQAQPATGSEALAQLARDINHPDPAALVKMGEELLHTLWIQDILLPLLPQQP